MYVKINKIDFITFFIFIVKFILSQNLVYNGGFEQYKIPLGFPIFSDIHFAKGWFNPNMSSPDSYHIQRNPNRSIISENGEIKPHTGNCYAGIGFFNTLNNYEYIQTKLTSSLKPNKTYCLTVYFSLGDKVNYSVNEIGFVLSKSKIKGKKKTIIDYKYHSLRNENLLNNKVKWIELKSIYTSNGEERYLTIGNFNRNIKYNFIGNSKNKKDIRSKYTYYYIDDISLVEIKDSSECNCKEILPKKDSIKVDTIKSVNQYDEALTSSIILKDINFETNKSELLQSSYSELAELVNYLKQNPSFKIEVNGYTDNTGKENDNVMLSQERAKAVVNYLIQGGIDKNRTTYKGYGSKNPLTKNDTDENKAKNRRVEFIIKTK